MGTLLELKWVREKISPLLDKGRILALGAVRAAQADYFIHAKAYDLYLDQVKNRIQSACAEETDLILMERLLKIFTDTGLCSPRPDDLPEMLGTTREKIDWLLEHLGNEGKLVHLPQNVVLSFEAYKEAQDKAIHIIKEESVLRSVDFKYALSSTRKYALAVLDFLDARRVTVRLDKHRRVLAPYYEKHLL
ncbi:MAG: SelB C-terminal domain-containing protein [Planctomycetota bacterium]